MSMTGGRGARAGASAIVNVVAGVIVSAPL